MSCAARRRPRRRPRPAQATLVPSRSARARPPDCGCSGSRSRSSASWPWPVTLAAGARFAQLAQAMGMAGNGGIMTKVLPRGGRTLIACALVQAATVALSGSALAGLPGASSQLTRAPYLTDLTGSSVRVSWGTRSQSRGLVEFGPVGHCAAGTAVSPKLGSPITINGVREYQNSVEITGLTHFTRYCYRVTTDTSPRVDLLGSNASPQFSTLQEGSAAGPFTFDVMGDWGDTTNEGVNDGSLNVNQARIDALISRSDAQFIVGTGDTAYQGGTQTNYSHLDQTGVNISAVFGPSYWAVPGQSVPFFAASGNHGLNSTFLSVWPETTTAAGSGGTYAVVPYPSIDGSG